MSTSSAPVNLSSRSVEIFIARQPIFDHSDTLVGYELLCRSSSARDRADGASQEAMSADVVVKALLSIGLDHLTGNRLAFVNFSREMLAQRTYELLDPQCVVIEVLESTDSDDVAVAACKELRRAQFGVALDDFSYEQRNAGLLPFATIVKIDVLGRSTEDLAAMVERLRPTGVRLLAERVETSAVRDACKELGFTLFQGYFYSRPELVTRRELPVAQVNIIRLMNLVRLPHVTDGEIEHAFGGDVALTYKLLRIVNAAATGGRGVESIQHAVRLLGRDMLYRWLALILLSSLSTENGVEAELVYAAVMRARLCELLAEQAGKRQATAPMFMVGLFSVLDALLKAPMQDILARIDVADEIRTALLRSGGPYVPPLQLVEAYERGQWDTVSQLSSRLGIAAREIPELYIQSLEWAREKLSAVE
jgi:c-di-GMP phosphodiesterase